KCPFGPTTLTNAGTPPVLPGPVSSPYLPPFAILTLDVLVGFRCVLGSHLRTIPVKSLADADAHGDAAEEDDLGEGGGDSRRAGGRGAAFDHADPLGFLANVVVGASLIARDGLGHSLASVVFAALAEFGFTCGQDEESRAVIIGRKNLAFV